METISQLRVHFQNDSILCLIDTKLASKARKEKKIVESKEFQSWNSSYGRQRELLEVTGLGI